MEFWWQYLWSFTFTFYFYCFSLLIIYFFFSFVLLFFFIRKHFSKNLNIKDSCYQVRAFTSGRFFCHFLHLRRRISLLCIKLENQISFILKKQKQEAHGTHCSRVNQFQWYKHICTKQWLCHNIKIFFLRIEWLIIYKIWVPFTQRNIAPS